MKLALVTYFFCSIILAPLLGVFFYYLFMFSGEAENDSFYGAIGMCGGAILVFVLGAKPLIREVKKILDDPDG